MEEIAVVFDGIAADPVHSEASGGVLRKSVEAESMTAGAEHV